MKDKFIEKLERQTIFWGWIKILAGVLVIAILTMILLDLTT